MKSVNLCSNFSFFLRLNGSSFQTGKGRFMKAFAEDYKHNSLPKSIMEDVTVT